MKKLMTRAIPILTTSLLLACSGKYYSKEDSTNNNLSNPDTSYEAKYSLEAELTGDEELDRIFLNPKDNIIYFRKGSLKNEFCNEPIFIHKLSSELLKERKYTLSVIKYGETNNIRLVEDHVIRAYRYNNEKSTLEKVLEFSFARGDFDSDGINDYFNSDSTGVYFIKGNKDGTYTSNTLVRPLSFFGFNNSLPVKMTCLVEEENLKKESVLIYGKEFLYLFDIRGGKPILNKIYDPERFEVIKLEE